MLTKEEIAEAYKNFDDDKVKKIALNESKSLREVTVPILISEIEKRNLDKSLLDWIKLERNFFKGAELENLKQIIKKSECSECGQKTDEIQGFHFHYLSALDHSFHSNIIVCESCGKKLRKKGYFTTATLGWLSLPSIFSVPFYFISELFASFSRKKESNRIIEEFIFENTGLIRENGNEKIHTLINHHNRQQLKEHEQ